MEFVDRHIDPTRWKFIIGFAFLKTGSFLILIEDGCTFAYVLNDFIFSINRKAFICHSESKSSIEIAKDFEVLGSEWITVMRLV
jgi:hypothetical protein